MNILFISMSRYPEGEGADVLRLKSLMSIFRRDTDSILTISRGEYTNFRINKNEINDYISFRGNKNDKMHKLFDLIMFSFRLKSFLKRCNKEWDVIVIESITNGSLKYLKKYAEERDVDLIYDCVEWFSKEEYRLRGLNYEYLTHNYRITKLLDRQFKVIAISTYLENYFKSRGIETIRIPVILDVKKIVYVKRKIINKLVFIYAGSPGGKDALDVMIKGFQLLTDNEKSRVEFRIVGVNWKWLKTRYYYSDSQIEEMKGYICVYGRVTHEQVQKLMEESDFSILLRPENLRYAQAGFPTKVVESMANGTPVICNMTSDLGMYIKDGYNGIIVSRCSASILSEVLRKILNIDRNIFMQMGKNARFCAEKEFSVETFAKALTNFI